MSKVSGSIIIAGLILGAIAVTGAGWARSSRLTHDVRVSVPHLPPSTLTQLPQPIPRPRQLVRVFVHREDIYPSVAHVRPGGLRLRVENETQSDVSLILEQVLPGQVRQHVTRVVTSQLGKRAENIMTLVAGEYVFFEEGQPEVQGKLIVEMN